MGGHLHASADDGDVPTGIEHGLNQTVHALHHRGRKEDVVQAVEAGMGFAHGHEGRFNDAKVQLDPGPFVQFSLVVEVERFRIVRSNRVIDDLPRRQVVHKDPVHVEA